MRLKNGLKVADALTKQEQARLVNRAARQVQNLQHKETSQPIQMRLQASYLTGSEFLG
jgi:hypothetical protein